MLIFFSLSSDFFIFGVFWVFVVSARAVKYGLREHICTVFFLVSLHVVSLAVII